MGNLIWHQWGRLLALAAATCMIWGSFWAFFYRKFFWDMIGGTLGPAGIIPGDNTKPFVNVVVTIPLVQTMTMAIGIFTLILEWPLPLVEGTSLHRSLVFRVVLYFMAGFLGIMVYQTVDRSIYYVITSGVYLKAVIKGERLVPGEEKLSIGEA